jgi:hypothetical protein
MADSNLAIIVFAFLLIPLFLIAQPNMGLMHGEGMDLPPVNNEEMKETLHTVMLIEMTKFVGLTNKQALAIAPFLDEITSAKEDYQKKQQENFQKLQTLVDTTKDEKEIKSLIETLKKDEKIFRDKDMDLREKLLNDLTTVQQAKMVLFQEHFKRKMQEIMRHARMMDNRKRIGEEREEHLKRINENKPDGIKMNPEPSPEPDPSEDEF